MTPNCLQKFTNEGLKLEDILALDRVTKDAIKDLCKQDREQLGQILTENFNGLKGIERDNFLEKYDDIIEPSTRNQLWENNHSQITWAISNLMQDYGRMPSKTEIATKTDLSRQTVHKHLKGYTDNPIYKQQVEQFKYMASKVLAKVFQFAVNGNMAAAKLYFEIISNSKNGQFPSNTIIQTQNNYIQINGLVLSQERIKQLTSEQLNTIEAILKDTLAEPGIDYSNLSDSTLEEIANQTPIAS